jgi:hypothetical protein
LQKNFKSNYLSTDPNKPFTPERVLSDSDDDYRIDLNEERLTRLYKLGMRLLNQKAKIEKKKQKNLGNSEKSLKSDEVNSS